MRHATILVAILTLTACELVTRPELTIQLQGTVTATDDGSPIAGASVELRLVVPTSIASWTSRSVGSSTTDAQGHYSLSYVKEGRCPLFVLLVNAQGFTGDSVGWLFDDPDITCTDKVQTFDFQLEREST